MMRKILTALLVSCAGMFPLKSDDYYVWQRQWDGALESAAKSCPAGSLSVLFAELEKHNGNWRWKQADIPEGIVFQTAVLRMNPFSPDVSSAWKTLFQAQLERLPKTVRRVEIDADIPERHLQKYADFLKEIRPLLNGKKLSVTVLPVHLKHQAFEAVIAQLDCYTLQLHGIANPRNPANRPYALMDETIALNAVGKALSFSKPFKIALPSYAYVIEFSPAGQFKRLYAENFPFARLSDRMKVIQPDMALIARVIRRYPEVGRIWFRLPCASDRFNLDMDALTALEKTASADSVPRPELHLTLSRKEHNLTLQAAFKNLIPDRTVPLDLNWPFPSEGETFLYNGTTLENGQSCVINGKLPRTLRIPPRRCGEIFNVCTFLLSDTELNIPAPVIKDTSLCLKYSPEW